MKGYLLRYRCPSVPVLQEVIDYCDDLDTFFACFHEDFTGDVVVEIACQRVPARFEHVAGTIDLEIARVHSLDWFGEALVEAGGVCICDGRPIEYEPHGEAWRRCMGLLTYVLDDVDVYHPRGLHACDYAKCTIDITSHY